MDVVYIESYLLSCDPELQVQWVPCLMYGDDGGLMCVSDASLGKYIREVE